jgi:hypothetical protein
MSAVREAFVLPLIFLTVALLGGFEPGGNVAWTGPSLFSLVLALMLLGALVRSGALAPEGLLNASRPILSNCNGAVVLVSLFAASAQLLHMLTPRSGLPLLLVGLVLFILLVNTLVVVPDRGRLIRSLGVLTGSAFLLKFIILSALADPEGSRTKRVLLALFDAATLGTVSQAPLHPAAGYVAFFVTLAFLVGVALLPHGTRIRGGWIQINADGEDDGPASAGTHRLNPKRRTD